MKTRRKTKYEIDTYIKMFDLRAGCLKVLEILEETYIREQVKQRQMLIDQAMFEMQLEQMLKDRGISGIEVPK